MDENEVVEWYVEKGAGPFSDIIAENGGILVWNSTEQEKTRFKSESIQNNTSVINGLVTRMGIQIAIGMAFLTASYTISGRSIPSVICAIVCLFIVIAGLFGTSPVMFFGVPDFQDEPLHRNNYILNRSLMSLGKDQTLEWQRVAVIKMTRCAEFQLWLVMIGMAVMITGLIQWRGGRTTSARRSRSHTGS